jgi:hypothetical protein
MMDKTRDACGQYVVNAMAGKAVKINWETLYLTACKIVREPITL